MITIFLICMFLIFLIYKYASLAILFIFDFVVLGIGSYVFLKSKIGNDSAIIATIIILLAYGAILLFTNKKISILGKIMNYIASLVGSIIGTEIIISLTTSVLKGIGIFENSYSSLVLTHNKFVDDIINFILVIIVSIFVYKKRMNFLNDKFGNNKTIYYTIIDENENNKENFEYEQNDYSNSYYNNKQYEKEERENSKDYYNILGVNKTATQNEIKKAYYKSMAKFHPDKNKNSDKANTITKLINEAYEVLSDEEKREQYDRFGTTL